MNKKIFIPIKEHSSRVKGKNFRLFDGLPLYEYLLFKYNNFDIDIYISTDSSRILKKYGKRNKNILAYRREDHLCGDDVSVNLLIDDFIKKYCKKEDIIAQIHATNPFLKAETVLNNFDFIEKRNCDSVASVNVIQSRLWRREGYGYCPINHNPMRMEKTQDLPKIYEENSCFYIFRYESFIKTRKRIGLKPEFIQVEFPENLDIDTEDDWNKCLDILFINKENL